MFKISKMRPKSPLSLLKAQNFSQCLSESRKQPDKYIRSIEACYTKYSNDGIDTITLFILKQLNLIKEHIP